MVNCFNIKHHVSKPLYVHVGISTGDETAHYYSTTEQGNIDKPIEAEYSLIVDDEYLQPVPETVNQLLPNLLEGNFSIETSFCLKSKIRFI